VFIDPGSLGTQTGTGTQTQTEDLRWLYTALTRATEEIYLLKSN